MRIRPASFSSGINARAKAYHGGYHENKYETLISFYAGGGAAFRMQQRKEARE